MSLTLPDGRRPRWRPLFIHVVRVYNWGIWTLLTVLLFAQFFGVIWSSVTTDILSVYGRPPSVGKYAIPGLNDEPCSDRAVVCVKSGEYYVPAQLSQLLRDRKRQEANTSDITPTSSRINGYRVVTRESFTMKAANYAHYNRQCSALSSTINNIFLACAALGYNTPQDFLRIVDGIDGDTVVTLPSALPVLIMPYWDHGAMARFFVPGQDGSACVFRGGGVFANDLEPTVALLYGVPRAVREAKTEQWLEYPGGVWRNGWYEDPVVKMRWYSDVISSAPRGEYGIALRQFDLNDNAREADCTNPPFGCRPRATMWQWDEYIRSSTMAYWYHSITISNGTRFGLFLYHGLTAQTITSQYSIEKLISNTMFATLLARWMTLLVALSPTDTIGLAALSNSRSFHYLPFFLLPRLKSSLQGFWTAGGYYEGNQRALSDAWFEIYPAVGEIVFLYFSLLNLLAKLLRRRASDVLFGPTLLLFGLLHYWRVELARWPVLGIGGRITTLVTATELEAASALDFFTTDLAFRVSGHVRSLFGVKLVVLSVNLVVPLLCSRRVAMSTDETTTTPLRVETALAIHLDGNAGLGSTRTPYVTNGNANAWALRPYELARAGYVVVGDAATSQLLVGVDHWMWLLVTAPLRTMATVLGIRVVNYPVVADDTTTDSERPTLAVWTIGGGRVAVASVAAQPQVVAVTDPEPFAGVRVGCVGVSALR